VSIFAENECKKNPASQFSIYPDHKLEGTKDPFNPSTGQFEANYDKENSNKSPSPRNQSHA
jgi:hypothetical protein